MNYKVSDIKIIGKSYRTSDGKYFTKADGSDYSYWWDENDGKTQFRLGNMGYDYLFFIGKEGIESALKVLNRIISE